MRASRWAANFLFPPTCAGCDRRCREPGFCPVCRRNIDRLPVASCSRCGRSFGSGDEHTCATCIARPPSFARFSACASYARESPDAPLSRAIRRLKYDRDVRYARPLAHMLATALADRCDFDAIVPVPLHISRLRWRGFNQAVLIGRPLARQCHRPLIPFALRRVRATAPQVGLTEIDRRRNMVDAFEIGCGSHLRGSRILLIDDVFTTGATVEECTKVLIRGGALRVEVAVLARAD